MRSRLIEFAHVALNVVFLRFYHFLQNCVDFIYIASLIVYLYGRARYPYADGLIAYLRDILTIVIFSHYLYSVTYIINDYVDYENDLRIRSDPDRYSFYRYRPAQYFGRSVMLLLFVFYVLLISVSWRLAFADILAIHEVILVALLYSFLSMLESLSKRKPIIKRCAFAAQLYSKYLILTVLLMRFLGLQISLYKIMEALACVTPYALYRSLQDVLKSYLSRGRLMSEDRQKDHIRTIFKDRAKAFMCFTVVAVLTIAGAVMLDYNILVAHLAVSVPFAVLTLAVPSMILGIHDRNLSSLYKRSGIKLLSTILLLSLVLSQL